MQFNSATFVFFFLPITLAVFHILRRYASTRIILAWLVMASLVFYGWWNPIYLPLIVLSMVANYVLGISAAKFNDSKTLLTCGVIFNLGLLGYFKYFNFFVDNVESLSGQEFSIESVALPLAISFFTFQQIAYQVDVYKEKTIERNFMTYALFVTFFPQLIAGPIVHHKQMMPQMAKIKTQSFTLHGNVFSGLVLFTIGLFKKVIIADALAEFANPLFNTDLAIYTPTAWEAWAATFSYTGQIYFDFSGYCDMAMGLALLFGITLPLNFLSPYKSRNISDFWRTWHITLGQFLRDYLYIYLGGNRVGIIKQMRNVVVVMFLGGLWHGANWTFVIWGLLHGLFLSIQALWTKLTKVPLPQAFSISVTFLCVSVSWIFFRSDTFSDAWVILNALDNFDTTRLPYFYDAPSWLSGSTQLVGLRSFHVFYWLAAAFLLFFWAPNSIQIREYFDKSFSINIKQGAIGGLLGIILLLMAINACKETNEFIYFNF